MSLHSNDDGADRTCGASAISRRQATYKGPIWGGCEMTRATIPIRSKEGEFTQ
jgi:hypothetical protein